MNQFADFENHKSRIANHPITQWADSPMTRFPKTAFIPRQVWVKLGTDRFGREVDDDN